MKRSGLAIVALSLVTTLAHLHFAAAIEPRGTSDPAARALFDKMSDAMRDAQSLSYTSRFTWSVDGDVVGDCTYRVWLMKPNYFRVEAEPNATGKTSGVLIGDGTTAWLYWPEGRPRWDVVGADPATEESSRTSSYRRVPARPGEYSIGHALDFAGGGMTLPVVNPSTFFRFPNYFMDFLDEVKGIETKQIAGRTCDGVEVGYMRGQRVWRLWLSRRDHLPRRLEQVVRVSLDAVFKEEWSHVEINQPIPNGLFTWTPPEGWTEWAPAAADDSLLAPGDAAPDFEFASTSGERLRLSGLRGRAVWLYFWRVGCPPCRVGMRPLQEFYAEHKDKGLVVLGFNPWDDKQIALGFLKEKGVQFPNVIESTDAADKVASDDYRCMGVPVNYFIDREGNVVDAWHGYEEGHKRARAALDRTLHDMETPVSK